MTKKICFVLLFVSFFVRSQEQYFQLRDFVTDSAAVFTVNDSQSLNQRLIDFEQETTNQIVVLTIQRLGANTIESYANAVFNANKIGQAEKDNGILILFSKADREVRIEVGYGLEPYITDAVASRIIRNTMIPYFKEGEYYTGVEQGAEQLITFLKNPEALAEFKQEIEAENKTPVWAYLIIGLLVLVFVGYGGFIFYKQYSQVIEIFRGLLLGKLSLLTGVLLLLPMAISSLFGLVFALIPIVILMQLDPQLDKLVDLVFNSLANVLWVGLLFPFFGLAYLIAFIKLKRGGNTDFKLSWFKNDKKYMSKTFSSFGSVSGSSGSYSGSSSSSFSRSSSSSSSFSGGGGSSGGGGASGSW
ncbi:TPM domain-containing protein [Croceivirga radicis]|uniref:TPM domain-containing protein n=1 Tax=Croceivirga radicis TaxID=1929488 RepID=UPI000255AFB7|nr:TPM domain-containing protein [Croceivirga radicis]